MSIANESVESAGKDVTPPTHLVSAPVSTLVWEGQAVRLYCAESKRSIGGLPPLVLELLTAFTQPRTRTEVVDGFAEGQRDEADALVDLLFSVGELRAVSSASTPAPFDVHHQTLLKIASLAGDLTAELHGMSDDLTSSLPASGGRPAEHLTMIAMQLQHLLSSLQKTRGDRLEAQLAALPPELLGSEVRLHLGAGNHGLPGWINIDGRTQGRPGWLAMNLRGPLPFGDASVTRVYSCHVVEHFTYSTGVLNLLREVRRVLRPGGVVRLVVPDIEAYARAYVDGDQEFFAADARACDWAAQTRTPLEQVLRWAGCRNDPFLGHQFGYDFETLSALLLEAGFDGVERCAFMQSRHEDLRVDDHSLAAAAAHRERSFSLFVEATVE